MKRIVKLLKWKEWVRRRASKGRSGCGTCGESVEFREEIYISDECKEDSMSYFLLYAE